MPRYMLTAITMTQNVKLERILVYMLWMFGLVVLFEEVYGVDYLLFYVLYLLIHHFTLVWLHVLQLV